MPEPPPPSLPRTRRVFGVLDPAQERTLRFIFGLAVLAQQFFFAGTIEPYAVGAGLVLAGSPLANQLDDARKRLRGGDQ